MEKEQFEKLNQDQKFSIISFYLGMTKEAIHSRMGLTPFISALFATFLAIGTFNEKLFPLDDTIRLILSALVLLIPLSLYFYNFDLKKWEQTSRHSIEKLVGKVEVESTFREKIITYLPDILIIILGVISIIVVYKIWIC